jgi:hypothetical protein
MGYKQGFGQVIICGCASHVIHRWWGMSFTSTIVQSISPRYVQQGKRPIAVLRFTLNQRSATAVTNLPIVIIIVPFTITTAITIITADLSECRMH